MAYLTTVSGRLLPVDPAYAALAAQDPAQAEAMCPVCGRRFPFRIRRWTLERMIRGWHFDKIRDAGFHFCETPTCPIVYFHNGESLYFALEDLQVPVGIKRLEAPVPVCYCKGVDEQTILYEIVVKRCCDSIKDIQAYTKARTGTECHIRNPSGRCCGDHVQAVLRKGLAMAADLLPVLRAEAEAAAAEIPADDSCCAVRS